MKSAHISYIFLGLLLAPVGVFGATLSFDYTLNAATSEIKVDVVADTSKDAPFNAIQSLVAFDQKIFSISDISTTGSPFDLWVFAPTTTPTGVFFVGGSTLRGGLTGKHTLFSIHLTPAQQGETVFQYKGSYIAKADGTGDDILESSFGLGLSHQSAK